MKTDPQNDLILEYLKSGNSITPIEALNLFGCFRLSARIYDLKKEGHDIKPVNITKNGKHFTRYYL
jgi:hypothetical protein